MSSDLPAPPPGVINLTPHDVVVWLDDDPDGVKMRYPASGEVARLGTVPLGTQYYRGVGVPVELVEFHHLLKPPPADGHWYIVSLPTALASPRDDFLVPYLEVRDDDGRIVGCRMLARPV